MTRRHALALLAAPAQKETEPNLRVVVSLETSLGEIVVALSGDRAPVTVENFLRYVDAGLYDGGVFHRTVKMDNQPQSPIQIEVIQGGPNPEKKQSFPPIRLERTALTGLKHVNGTISMARFAPDTASGDFFFCIGDQPELDFGGKRNPDGQGFAAFGLVLKGFDVIRKIQQAPATGQRITPPVKIERIRRVEGPPRRPL
jgi:peptidyl-prolyl cis-trans isomerase A (cyclophilin A)